MEELLYRDKEWLREQYIKRGLLKQDIARNCGTHRVTVSKWLKFHGISREKPVYHHYDWLYQKYWVEKLSMQSIATLCSVSVSTITEFIEKLKIKKRSRREAGKERQKRNVQKYKNETWLYQQYIDQQLSSTVIARECGVDPQTILFWLKVFNIDRRDNGASHRGLNKKFNQPKQWLQQKYLTERLSLSDMATLANVSTSTIRYYLQRHEIPIRNKVKAKQEWWDKQPGLHKNEEWLYQKYVTEELPAQNIASLCGLKSGDAILAWLKKFGIDRRRCHTHMENGNNPNIGRKHTQATRKKMSILKKEYLKNNPDKVLRGSDHPNWGKSRPHTEEEKQMMRNKWKDPEYAKKILRSNAQRPTKPENAYDEMTPDIIRYIGNRSWWRLLPNGKYKNPDFKVTGQNKVIEIFGKHWHENDNPDELIDLYKQIGLDCLVFWDYEVYGTPDVVLEKTIDFISS